MTGPDLPVPSETERAAARQQSELSMLRSHTGTLSAENARLWGERHQLSSMLRAMARRSSELRRAGVGAGVLLSARSITQHATARAQRAEAEVAELRRAAADEPSRPLGGDEK